MSQHLACHLAPCSPGDSHAPVVRGGSTVVRVVSRRSSFGACSPRRALRTRIGQRCAAGLAAGQQGAASPCVGCVAWNRVISIVYGARAGAAHRVSCRGWTSSGATAMTTRIATRLVMGTEYRNQEDRSCREPG
jgi:hypothetical protein